MGVFIANARAEIEKLWDELMVGEEEMSDFVYFREGEYICIVFALPGLLILL